MNTPSPRNLSRLGFALTWVLFGISLWLPAAAHLTGWECAEIARDALLNFNKAITSPELTEIWRWLYYSAFNVTNLTLLLLPLLAFIPFGDRCLKAARWLAGACFLHTLSWLVLTLSRNGIRDLKAGYYLWLCAIGLLLATCVYRVRQIATQASTN